MLERNKKKIYFCKRNLVNDIETFDPPVTIEVNPITLSFAWNADMIGAIESGKLIFALDSSVYKLLFTLGDRFYVDTMYKVTEFFPYGVEPFGFYQTEPDEIIDFDGSAQDADYVLTGISSTPNVVALTLTRLAV